MILAVELEKYLDDLMNAAEFKDYAPNGMQVQGKPEINKLLAATSATIAVVDQAIAVNADAIFVHHGWFFSNERRAIKSAFYEKVSKLIKNDINLFAYHLPLDVVENYGNNHSVLKDFQCSDIELFADYGYLGTLPKEMSATKFTAMLNIYYSTKGRHVIPKETGGISRIAMLSGQGTGFMRNVVDHNESTDQKIDAFITGEGTEWSYSLAQENNILYSAMGHYKSEVIGPKKMAAHLEEKFQIETAFFEEPNPF